MKESVAQWYHTSTVKNHSDECAAAGVSFRQYEKDFTVPWRAMHHWTNPQCRDDRRYEMASCAATELVLPREVCMLPLLSNCGACRDLPGTFLLVYKTA